MTDFKRPTKKQRELLSFIDGFIKGHGYGPSYREVMRALDYKSVSTVAVHIDSLIAKGYLNKRDRSARSLEVVTLDVSSDPPEGSAHRAPTPAQEKWLINAINDRFDTLSKNYSDQTMDELYVLVGALKVLGLDGAHVAMRTRLFEVNKNKK
jgi:repressor LexA